MRFLRKVIPPNVERRNFLMRKLHEFKGCKGLPKDLRTKLRLEISKCDGYAQYFIDHKGLLIFVGNEQTPKKRLLLYKDPLFVQPLLQTIRKARRKMHETPRRHPINALGEYVSYNKINGVLTKPGTFAAKDMDIRRRVVTKAKKPRDTDSYIGLELEFASRLSAAEVTELIAKERLHKELRVVFDRSIEVDSAYRHQIEICVLTRYRDLENMLQRLKKIINPTDFNANYSCGLHVHLDVRVDDVRRVYRNLASMQSLLFKLAGNWREASSYCRRVSSTEFVDDSDLDHYAAISKSSFSEHGSVEVRIHHSTTDMDLIGKWVHLLKRIGDYKGEKLAVWPLVDSIKTEIEVAMDELKTKIKPSEDILKYVEEKLVV